MVYVNAQFPVDRQSVAFCFHLSLDVIIIIIVICEWNDVEKNYCCDYSVRRVGAMPLLLSSDWYGRCKMTNKLLRFVLLPSLHPPYALQSLAVILSFDVRPAIVTNVELRHNGCINVIVYHVLKTPHSISTGLGDPTLHSLVYSDKSLVCNAIL